ncbi:MAG: NAD-dependent epimerase/dehydratase family protein [Bacteroidetes bacterium]|nr:NAD-dependent epimerase/dehydratase family protein [Bacteroidota bacterium]
MKTAGIIGGAGFIGSHITKKFLEEGYRVRVSASDIANTGKYAHLYALPNAERLELAPLDVRNPAQLAAFLPGCAIVVHAGTPFQLDVKDPQSELIMPTVQGTRNFLAAAEHLPGLRKVVFIASVAAYNTDFPMLPNGKQPGDRVSEKDPPYFSAGSHPYAQAKFMANEVVNDFIAAHPDLPFNITSVSPTGVLGTALSQRADSTSMGLQYLLQHRIAPNPFIQMIYDRDLEWASVDVCDVADAVYHAATTAGLHGRNYLLSGESYPVSDIHALLNGREPAKTPSIVYDSALAQRELGIRFRPVRSTLENYRTATQTQTA